MHSFYKKLEDKTQYKNIVSLMDKAWNDTSKTVKGKNAKKALSKFKQQDSTFVKIQRDSITIKLPIVFQ